MYGLIIAVLVAGWAMLIGGNTIEAAFLSASWFLWNWYWVWTLFLGAFIGLVALGITGTTTVAGSQVTGSKLGMIAGMAAVGGLSLKMFPKLALQRALLLLGSYALMNAGTPETTFAEFNKTYLIVGSALLFVGYITDRRRASSD